MSDLATLTFADDIATDYANVVLYGEPGSGKSAAAATAPGPLLWLNLEGRNSTAYARKIVRREGGSIREVIAAEQVGLTTVQVLHSFVEEARAGALSGRYVTIVVDTLGALRSMLVKDFVQKGSRNTLQQYGRVADEMSAFILGLRDVPANVVFLSHEEEVKNEDGAVVKVRPMIGGKATDEVIKEMDVVGFCTVLPGKEGGPEQYVAQFKLGKGRVAKDRSDGLGAFGPSSAGHIIPTFLDALSTPDDSKAEEVEAAFTEMFDATPADQAAAQVPGFPPHDSIDEAADAERFMAEQRALDAQAAQS